MKLGEDISQEEFDDIIRICRQEKPDCFLGSKINGVAAIWTEKEDDIVGYSLLVTNYKNESKGKKFKRYKNYFLYGTRNKHTYCIYLIKNGISPDKVRLSKK